MNHRDHFFPGLFYRNTLIPGVFFHKCAEVSGSHSLDIRPSHVLAYSLSRLMEGYTIIPGILPDTLHYPLLH